MGKQEKSVKRNADGTGMFQKGYDNMKFTKYNNPSKKRRTVRRSPYSPQYIAERRSEMERLLANAETDDEKDAIIKAFDVTIYPY